MKSITFIIIFILLVTSDCNLFSQDLKLKIKTYDSLNIDFIKNIHYKTNFNSTNDIKLTLDSVKKTLQVNGYLNAKIISKLNTDSTTLVTFKLNNRLKKITLSLNDTLITKQFLLQKQLKIKNKKLTIPFIDVHRFIVELAAYYSKMGYPFAKIQLQNFSIINKTAFANLIIESEKQRTIDKIIINGYRKFPKKHIGIKINKKQKLLFNKQYLNKLTSKINNIPFVSSIKKPQVLFLNDSTLIYIYLKKKQINQFDGIIGFSSNEKKRLLFNGYLNLLLNNVFNKGEQILLKWKSTSEQNKQFNLGVNLPYIFNSNIHTKVNFSLFSQDSSFINIQSKLNLNYNINQLTKIGLILKSEKSTNLIDSDINTKNYKTIFYGITYQYKTTSPNTFYKIRKLIDISLLYGNQNSEDLIYDKYKINTTLSYFLKLTTKNSIFIKNSNSLILSNNYYENELERIGGRKSLRGFTENSIPSSKYNITSIDYGYLINKNTLIYLNSDLGYLKNDALNNTNNLYGIGVGYKNKFKKAILDINYSIGNDVNGGFSTKQGVLNIAFINYF